MPGGTVKVQVTFPDPYTPNTDLSGKQAVFDTTINYIHGDAQPPELTEDFVTNYLSYYYGYTSVEDMRQKISAQLLEEQKYNYVLDWLYDNCTFQPVPEQLVQDQLTILDTELANAANGYGKYKINVKLNEELSSSKIDAACKAMEDAVAGVADCTATVQQYGMTDDLTSQLSTGLTIKIYGTDAETLTALSEKVVDIVNNTDGFQNATNGLGAGDSTIAIRYAPTA